MSNHQIGNKPSRSGRNSDWYVFWPAWVLCAALLFFGAFVLCWEYRVETPKKSDIPVVALSEGQNLHLDPAKLGPGQLHLFEARVSGHEVKFIVQRTPDKIVHVALANCNACYRKRNSHYAKNGEMICGQCQTVMIVESKGRKPVPNHCALVEIPHSATDSELSVSARDVSAEAAKIPQ
jgi:uncharacterized membrane protein